MNACALELALRVVEVVLAFRGQVLAELWVVVSSPEVALALCQALGAEMMVHKDQTLQVVLVDYIAGILWRGACP